MNEPTRRFSFTSLSHVLFQSPVFFHLSPAPPHSLGERWGWSLATRPLPAVASPLLDQPGGPHPAPLPHGLQQMDHSFRGYSSSVGVAEASTWASLGASPRPAAAPDKTGCRRTPGPGTPWAPRCPPSARHTPFTVVGTETWRAKASRSQPLPAGQGCLPDLASRCPRGAHALPSPC